MKTRPLTLAGLLVGSSLAFGGPFAPIHDAWAQKPKPAAKAAGKGAAAEDKAQLTEAKKHYSEGEAKYKAGSFSEALTEFEQADKIKPTPQAARYIGLCEDNLGQFPEAVAAYERFLAAVPAKMAMEGDRIKQRVEQIKQLPGKIHADSDPKGASVAVDGKPQPNVTPTDIELPPGHHALHFTAEGHDAVDKDVDVTFASKQDVTVTLPASAPPPAPPVAVVAPPPEQTPPSPPPEPVHHSKLPAYITGGLAVAAAGVGTVFGVMALSDKSSFDANPTTQKADDGENHALIADMAFGVAVTLGVTSAVLFLSNDDTPAPPQTGSNGEHVASAKPKHGFSITPSPIVTQHGAGAGAVIRF